MPRAMALLTGCQPLSLPDQLTGWNKACGKAEKAHPQTTLEPPASLQPSFLGCLGWAVDGHSRPVPLLGAGAE